MALYSSSPPAFLRGQVASPPSSHLECEAVQQRPSSKPPAMQGGLSCLFSSSKPLSETLESSSTSSATSTSPSSSGLIKSRSHNDLYSVRECGESWCGSSVGISSGKSRECSPISVFQGPSSYGSSTCGNINSCRLPAAAMVSRDGHCRRRKSASFENHNKRPLFRLEGFEIRRECSWSSFSSGAHVATELSERSDFMEEESTYSGLCLNSENLCPAVLDTPKEEHLIASCLLKLKASFADDILRSAQAKFNVFNDPFVVKAFREAEKVHLGQCRATGDPNLVHCLETALILAKAGGNKCIIAAGLLHEALDDSSCDELQLRVSFGDDVANLVQGVSRLSELSQLARDNDTAKNSLEADRVRTMFLAMVDVRVVFVKLADRLHNMRTLGVLSEDKQHRMAWETLQIFAPLAGRLGIWSWKAELEDLCFKYLMPAEHQKLSDELSSTSRNMYMMFAIEKLDVALKKAGVQFHDLCGRTKNLYSIHSKMSRKGRSLCEIFDVRALRLIVADESSCFSALELIHELWPCIPGKQKDYINQPKQNGYRSLHTAVMVEDGLPLEVQIRTVDMHHHAEFGIAAHWRYKEGDSKYSSYISQRVEWARWVLTWHSEVVDLKVRLSPLEMDLRPPCPFPFHLEISQHSSSQAESNEDGEAEDLLFIIVLGDEKMIVQELPYGSTALDLLVEMRPKVFESNDGELGEWKDKRLFINHKIVDSLDQKLAMGDIAEVIPFVIPESLDECRETIRRMYGDNATDEIVHSTVSPVAISLSS